MQIALLLKGRNAGQIPDMKELTACGSEII